MSFQAKRAHLCGVARGRKMFEGTRDMTPARFDLLYLLHERVPRSLRFLREDLHETAQSQLTRALGLARQTVWKMVERLVELGLVTKRRDRPGHSRSNLIKLTEEGRRRVRQAMGAAFSESLPIPKDAPTCSPVPRYWRRPDLADVVVGANGATVPRKVGREVGKLFTAFAWKRLEGGRRGKQERHMELLERMIQYATDLARALGDTSESMYKLNYEPDH